MRRVLLAPLVAPLVAPLAVLLPLFAIAGCEGGGPPPSGPPGPTEGLRASFPKGGLADTIRIDAIERLPLRAAVLVAPDGTTLAAGTIDVTDSPSIATGQWAAGDPWRNALSGSGSAAALAMQHADVGAALQGRQQLLATVSTAEIPLPDPVSYRRQWGKYRIRLSFGTPPGEIETREIAAPEPSP